MVAAVFLLTGDYVLAVLVAEVLVEPLCGIRGIGVGKSAGRGEVFQALVGRGEREVIEVGVAPVSLELNGVLAGGEVDNSAGGLREAGRIGESDLALIDAVYIEVLHLFVGVGGLTVSDSELIETSLGDVHFNGK